MREERKSRREEEARWEGERGKKRMRGRDERER